MDGDIRGTILMDLIGGINPDRVYFDEFGAALASNPFSIFDGSGEINLGFSAVPRHDLWRDLALGKPAHHAGQFQLWRVQWHLRPQSWRRCGGHPDAQQGARAPNRAISKRCRCGRANGTVARPGWRDGEGQLLQLSDPRGYRLTASSTSCTSSHDGDNFDDEIIVGEGLVVTTNLRGGLGNDVLSGGDFTDTLYGEDGNDVLFGFAGKRSALRRPWERFPARRRRGRYSVRGRRDRPCQLCRQQCRGHDQLRDGVFAGGDATGDVLTSIESVDGTDHNDTITGSVRHRQFLRLCGQ